MSSGPIPSQTGSLLAALAYAGIGAGVGSIGAALVTSKSGKGEARAHAADLLSQAAGGLADRLATNNADMHRENRELRKTISGLSDAIDLILPYLAGNLPQEILEDIKKINRNSKLSV